MGGRRGHGGRPRDAQLGVIAHLQAGTALTDIERARLQVAAREVTTKHEEPREMDDVLIGRMRRRIRTCRQATPGNTRKR